MEGGPLRDGLICGLMSFCKIVFVLLFLAYTQTGVATWSLRCIYRVAVVTVWRGTLSLVGGYSQLHYQTNSSLP